MILEIKRWDRKMEERVLNQKVDLFIKDIKKVFENHGMCISHEDGQGSFIIESYDERTVEWLEHASVDL